jgi:phage antirepressor YoqD-like protein
MTNLIKTFDASILEIDQEKGMVNLTRIAKHFGKNVKDWTRNKNTQSFLSAYATEYSDGHILLSERGVGIEQGTWAVRQVAIEFAQWISPKFKVFCIKKLDELFQTGRTEIKTFSLKESLKLAYEAVERAEMAEEQVKLLTEVVNEQAPKVEYVEKVLMASNTWVTTNIAAELQMSAIALNTLLKDKGVHRKVNGVWTLNAKYQGHDYTSTRTHSYTDKKGEQQTSHLTVWTEKGREFIHKLVNENLNLIKKAQ